MEKSAMIRRISAQNRKTKRQELAGDALEFGAMLVIVAGLIAFMFMGYGLGIQ